MNEKELKRLWPEPPGTAMERLVHFLDLFDHLPDDELALRTTQGLYGKSVTTGMTLGDLREILRRLQV